MDPQSLSPHLGPELPPEWRRYRDGFAVLQYLHALSLHREVGAVSWPGVAAALGLAAEEAEPLRRYLVWNGCLDLGSQFRRVTLTRAAVDYLERGSGRRHSVRPQDA